MKCSLNITHGRGVSGRGHPWQGECMAGRHLCVCRILRDMVNEWAVHILLGCILVDKSFTETKQSSFRCMPPAIHTPSHACPPPGTEWHMLLKTLLPTTSFAGGNKMMCLKQWYIGVYECHLMYCVSGISMQWTFVSESNSSPYLVINTEKNCATFNHHFWMLISWGSNFLARRLIHWA